MALQHYGLLFIFVCGSSAVITLLFYAITNQAWVSSFVLACITTILALENSSLYYEMKQKDEDIEVLKTLQSDKLLYKMKQMEVELDFLKKDREKLRLTVTNLKLMYKMRKSGSL